MNTSTILIHRHYKHYKGGFYYLITIGKLESEGEKGEDYCVYQSMDCGNIRICSLSEFREKFTLITQKPKARELDRNQTALAILQALITAYPDDHIDQVSKKAYKLADIFIKESQKQDIN